MMSIQSEKAKKQGDRLRVALEMNKGKTCGQ